MPVAYTVRETGTVPPEHRAVASRTNGGYNPTELFADVGKDNEPFGPWSSWTARQVYAALHPGELDL